MRRLRHPLAILGLALFFIFGPWLLRPGARLTITAAEPGREVALQGRWVTDGDTSEVMRLATPVTIDLRRRGVFEAEFIMANPHDRIIAVLDRLGARPDTVARSVGLSFELGVTDRNTSFSFSARGGGACDPVAGINPDYVPLKRGVPLCRLTAEPTPGSSCKASDRAEITDLPSVPTAARRVRCALGATDPPSFEDESGPSEHDQGA